MRRALLAVGLLLVTASPAAALERGGTEFWSAREHALDVAAGGWRLRIGLDKHTVADPWTAEVSGPGGSRTLQVPTGLYSGELLFELPEAGRWTVRVTPGGQDRRFRMRAKLEQEPAEPAPPVDELPNLQALPPWDLSFRFPVTNGTTDPPQGLSLPGGRLACHLEEVLESRALRCLRMAFGVRNTGRGPMDLMLGAGADGADRELIQQVHRSDGTGRLRVSGTARFHASHGHYHHDKAISLELLHPDGTAAAPVHMKGFAHRDELLREWTMFHPTVEKDGFGLNPGWGDYYEWDRPGNFVDFGLNGDGRYVLRLVADPVEGILESDEGDNAGYSVIDVAGDRVTLVESGRGTGPWDRCRILVPLGPEPDLPAGRTQHLRPADCPTDTVDPDPPAAPVTSPGVTPAPAYVPKPASRPPAVKKKKAKRCPRLRRGMSAKRRAAARRCRRAQQRRRGSGRG